MSNPNQNSAIESGQHAENMPPPSYSWAINNSLENKQDFVETNNLENINSIQSSSINSNAQNNSNEEELDQIVNPISSNQQNEQLEPDFSKKAVRILFVRNVFSIIMLLFCIKTGIFAFVLYHNPTKNFIRRLPFICYLSGGFIYITLIFILSIDIEIRRRNPRKYICLAALSSIFTWYLITLVAAFNSEVILHTAGLIVLICFCMVVFTFQTHWNLKYPESLLLIGPVSLLLHGISVGIFVVIFEMQYIILLVSLIGAFIIIAYMAYLVQTMMDGVYRDSMLPTEHIFATLNIYVDLILPKSACKCGWWKN